jgi:hypothetical protein
VEGHRISNNYRVLYDWLIDWSLFMFNLSTKYSEWVIVV